MSVYISARFIGKRLERVDLAEQLFASIELTLCQPNLCKVIDCAAGVVTSRQKRLECKRAVFEGFVEMSRQIEEVSKIAERYSMSHRVTTLMTQLCTTPGVRESPVEI